MSLVKEIWRGTFGAVVNDFDQMFDRKKLFNLRENCGTYMYHWVRNGLISFLKNTQRFEPVPVAKMPPLSRPTGWLDCTWRDRRDKQREETFSDNFRRTRDREITDKLIPSQQVATTAVGFRRKIRKTESHWASWTNSVFQFQTSSPTFILSKNDLPYFTDYKQHLGDIL